MTARVLASPAAEVRRLRAERDELLHQLGDELLHRVGALVAALPDPMAEVELRRQLCREAAAAERERSWSEGYAAAVADIKRVQHEVRDAVRLVGRRAAPCGGAWLDAVERHDGTEYGGTGQPRIPVPAAVIERAREVKAA